VGSGFSVIADLSTYPVPAERGFVAVGFGTSAFFGGGNRERAGDRAVVGDDVDTLGGDGDTKMRHRFRLKLDETL
jgi:hypothetical protein